jgi:hypothetical protein
LVDAAATVTRRQHVQQVRTLPRALIDVSSVCNEQLGNATAVVGRLSLEVQMQRAFSTLIRDFGSEARLQCYGQKMLNDFICHA